MLLLKIICFEFRFSTDGELIYGGMPINGNDIWELKSPYDKKATRLIPSDAYARYAVIEHLEKNHYFSVDEEINFELLYRTVLETEYFTFKAEIKDVFEEKVLYSSDVNTKTSRFGKNYRQISASAHFPRLKVGVYKIVYTVYYGSDVHKVISVAFEVYDENSELCPPLESELPVMFIMNNEQKNLERNDFDILPPMTSCDFGHYIAYTTNTPVEAEKLQIWIYAYLRKKMVCLACNTHLQRLFVARSRRNDRECRFSFPYGPFAPYFAPTLTYHSLRYFGFPDDDMLCK